MGVLFPATSLLSQVRASKRSCSASSSRFCSASVRVKFSSCLLLATCFSRYLLALSLLRSFLCASFSFALSCSVVDEDPGCFATGCRCRTDSLRLEDDLVSAADSVLTIVVGVVLAEESVMLEWLDVSISNIGHAIREGSRVSSAVASLAAVGVGKSSVKGSVTVNSGVEPEAASSMEDRSSVLFIAGLGTER